MYATISRKCQGLDTISYSMVCYLLQHHSPQEICIRYRDSTKFYQANTDTNQLISDVIRLQLTHTHTERGR